VAFPLRFFAAGDGVREMPFNFSLSSARLPLDSISGAEGHGFDFHGIPRHSLSDPVSRCKGRRNAGVVSLSCSFVKVSAQLVVVGLLLPLHEEENDLSSPRPTAHSRMNVDSRLGHPRVPLWYPGNT
jgi:hypothetical protein